MYRNRMIELTNLSRKSQRVGSKLKELIKFPLTPEPFAYINNLLNTFVKNNNQINSQRNQYKKTANPAKEKEITNRVKRAIQENTMLLTKIHDQIKKINEEHQQNLQNGHKSQTVRVAQINQKTSQAIQNFRDNQQKFSGGVKDTIRRQATIIQGEISQGEIQNIIKNPEQGQQMLRAKLLDQPSVQLQNAVSDIIDKYRQILQLQKVRDFVFQSMQECLQMMQEMALLVAMTGQQLGSIQATISETKDYIINADAKLVKAKQHHKSARSKMCCIIMLLLTVIGAVLIPVLITQL